LFIRILVNLNFFSLLSHNFAYFSCWTVEIELKKELFSFTSFFANVGKVDWNFYLVFEWFIEFNLFESFFLMCMRMRVHDRLIFREDSDSHYSDLISANWNYWVCWFWIQLEIQIMRIQFENSWSCTWWNFNKELQFNNVKMKFVETSLNSSRNSRLRWFSINIRIPIFKANNMNINCS
jgi:hypothetical protein